MQEKLNQLKDNFGAMPFNKKVLLGTAFAIGIGVTATALSLIEQPDYVTMMTNLDPASLQTILPALEAEKIPFTVSPNKTTLFVDKDSIQKATVILAKNGLPSKPITGYDHLNNSTSPYLTATESAQLSQQILEENIEASILQFNVIEKAQVRLALSKTSQFLRDTKPATASVTLTIKQGYSLSKSQVNGIAKLVSFSVPNLPQENVVILDDTANVMYKGGDSSITNGDSTFDTKILIENELQQKVIDVVAPIVGIKNIRVNIGAEINFDKIENTKEEPISNSIILSKQTEKTYNSELNGGSGVVGSISNQPPKHAKFEKTPKNKSPENEKDKLSHLKETVNYSVGKSITHTIKNSGNIKKLNIAILFDKGLLKNKELESQINTILSLAKSSVGFDEKRGDIITVKATSFAQPQNNSKQKIPFYDQKIVKDAISATKWIGAILLIWLLFWRPLLNRISSNEEKLPEENNDKNIESEDRSLHIHDDNELQIIDSNIVNEVEYESEKLKALDTISSNQTESQNVLQSWINNVSLEISEDNLSENQEEQVDNDESDKGNNSDEK